MTSPIPSPNESVDSVYRLMFEESPDAIFVEGYDGTVLDANQEAVRMHGMERKADLIGKNVLDLVPPADREQTRKDFQGWLDGTVTQYRAHSLRRDGQSVPIDIRARKVRFQGRDALLFHVRDASLTEARENNLRRQRERYRHVLDALQVGVWTLDEASRGTYANPALLALLGRGEAEIRDRAFTGFIHSGDPLRGHPPSAILRLLREHPREILFADAKGKPVPSLVTLCQTPSHPDADEILLTVENLSEKHLLRQQLYQAQKMEAFGRMVGGIAHDFNNLLTALSGQTEFLKAQVGENAGLAGDVDRLQAITERATRLVGQLMAFSRRDAVGEERVELNGLVRRIGEMSGRLLPKSIVLEVRESGTPLWISGSPGSLEQVLMNLVINARDAMPEGGKLTLRVEERPPRPEELDEFLQGLPFIQGRMACVSVGDNGSGMSPEVLRNIFEPFYTTKPKGQGTGLGLSTAYAMVSQHQGAIAVRSAPGQGTDFKLFFPTAVLAPETAPAPDAPATKRLVLLVEDEESVRKVTQEMLRHLGLDVLAFASAEDVLAAQATPTASVVVSDLLLPGMHGLDLIRKLRERQPALPAILITGCDEEQVRRAGAMPERTRVLHKPYRMAQFQEAMREWTG